MPLFLHVPGHGLLGSGICLRLPQDEITHGLPPGSPGATEIFLQQLRQLWYLRLTPLLPQSRYQPTNTWLVWQPVSWLSDQHTASWTLEFWCQSGTTQIAFLPSHCLFIEQACFHILLKQHSLPRPCWNSISIPLDRAGATCRLKTAWLSWVPHITTHLCPSSRATWSLWLRYHAGSATWVSMLGYARRLFPSRFGTLLQQTQENHHFVVGHGDEAVLRVHTANRPWDNCFWSTNLQTSLVMSTWDKLGTSDICTIHAFSPGFIVFFSHTISGNSRSFSGYSRT